MKRLILRVICETRVSNQLNGAMISYAQDNSKWLEWQHDYQFGAFYVIPPKEVLAIVDELRARHDPTSASYCCGHISLSRPLKSVLTDDQLDELRLSMSNFPSFKVRYGPLITYPPHPGVCFDIQPNDKFIELKDRVHSTSAFTGFTYRRDSIPAHMTIAEFGYTWEQSEDLRKDLENKVPSGEFLCDCIEYAVPNNEFFFERKLKVALGAI
ncbi:MAG: 2'-5' RNA ligase family protein [Acidobacteria bacterium]|nr:2'-5' RNA ligase family protein [Acidobacteriota bacterium]